MKELIDQELGQGKATAQDDSGEGGFYCDRGREVGPTWMCFLVFSPMTGVVGILHVPSINGHVFTVKDWAGSISSWWNVATCQRADSEHRVDTSVLSTDGQYRLVHRTFESAWGPVSSTRTVLSA